MCIKQETSLIIYAVNIHTGGGKILLDEILAHQALGPVTAAFLDKRYQVTKANRPFEIFYSGSKILGRLLSELKLHQFLKSHKALSQEEVLFFGNIPPFFKPRNFSILYLQNCFLTRQVPLPTDTRKEMLRNWIESVILKFFFKNVDEIWVQTPWMKRRLIVPKPKCALKPYFPTLKCFQA
jgi:hypothetical protein